MNWQEVTAVFGGTFDPPHSAHLQAMTGLLKSPGIRRVIVTPSASPAYKPTVAATQDRVAMVRLLIEEARNQGEFVLDEREIRMNERNPAQPTYSYYLLEEMRREIRDLAFVIGTDQLEKLPSWHRFPEVLGLCHWIVLVRQPYSPDQALQSAARLEKTGVLSRDSAPSGHFGSWRIRTSGSTQPKILTVVPTPAAALSSTEIRETIARTGNAPAGSLPVQVEAYLKRRRIYGTKAGESRP